MADIVSVPTNDQDTDLFDLPVSASDGDGGDVAGRVVCTQHADTVYLLTFSHGPENRLSAHLCRALLLALDIIEHNHMPGVVITTSSTPRIYSLGERFHAEGRGDDDKKALFALYRRLLTYPQPTVALLNGHAGAAGLGLALMHDYRVMNPHRGTLWLCDEGAGGGSSAEDDFADGNAAVSAGGKEDVLPRAPILAIVRAKLSGHALRRLVLEAGRLKPLDALREGIIDHLGDLADAFAYIDEVSLVARAKASVASISGRSGVSSLASSTSSHVSGSTAESSLRHMVHRGPSSVYGDLKRAIWREALDLLDDDNTTDDDARVERERDRREKEISDSQRRASEWSRQQT